MKTTSKYLITIVLLLTTSITLPVFAQGIDQIADRLEIAEVVAKYSYTNDYPDPEGYAALFTEDAILEVFVRDAKEPFLRVETRENLLASANSREPSTTKTGHHQSGLIFLELTENTARTQNMVLLSRQEADESIPSIVSAGTYYDTWRKTADGWKFAHRLLRIDGN